MKRVNEICEYEYHEEARSCGMGLLIYIIGLTFVGAKLVVEDTRTLTKNLDNRIMAISAHPQKYKQTVQYSALPATNEHINLYNINNEFKR